MAEHRDYQAEAQSLVLSRWNRVLLPHRHVLLLSPTGSGKTVMAFNLFAKDRLAVSGARALFIADTRKIINQTALKARLRDDIGSVGQIGDGRREFNKTFTVATIQSLDRPGAIGRLLAAGPITHLFVDEAHLSWRNRMYRRIIRSILATNKKMKVLGMTATVEPYHQLWRFYHSKPVKIKQKPLQKQGYLAKPKVILCRARTYQDVFRQWRKHAHDRRTLVFTRSVREAYAVAATFQENGVYAVPVHAGTPRSVRDVVEQEAQVLCSCGVYNKGADLPNIGCVALLGREKRETPYIQKAGRGARPDTEGYIILNFSFRLHRLESRGRVI